MNIPLSNAHKIQITEFVMAAIPIAIRVLVAVILLAGTILLVWPKKAGRRWVNEVLLVFGIFLVLPTALSVLIAGCSVVDPNRSRVFVSPDNSLVADYTYESGFLGRDYSGVAIRLSGSLHKDDAYFYFGPSDRNGTSIQWLDDRNLEISYYLDPRGRTQVCNAIAAGVKIHCKQLKYPDTR